MVLGEEALEDLSLGRVAYAGKVSILGQITGQRMCT